MAVARVAPRHRVIRRGERMLDAARIRRDGGGVPHVGEKGERNDPLRRRRTGPLRQRWLRLVRRDAPQLHELGVEPRLDALDVRAEDLAGIAEVAAVGELERKEEVGVDRVGVPDALAGRSAGPRAGDAHGELVGVGPAAERGPGPEERVRGQGVDHRGDELDPA